MTKKDILKEFIKTKAKGTIELQLGSVLYSKSLENDPAWMMLDPPLNWGVEDTSTNVDVYLYK